MSTSTTTTTRSDLQSRAIAHARREQAATRAALVAEVDAAIALVGWDQARPHVVAVLGASVPLSGPRGRWRGLLRVRTTRRLLDQLDQLPAQPHLPLYSPSPALQPAGSVTTNPEATP